MNNHRIIIISEKLLGERRTRQASTERGSQRVSPFNLVLPEKRNKPEGSDAQAASIIRSVGRNFA
jgi:hypothetical protein